MRSWTFASYRDLGRRQYVMLRRENRPTLLSQIHFDLKRFEVVRDIRLDLLSHALVGPLLQSVELFVHVHLVYSLSLRCQV